MKQKITALCLAVFSALVVSLPIPSAHAQAAKDIGGIMVFHYKPNGTVSGLDGMINLDQITDLQDAQRCDHSSAIVTIYTVVYEGTSEIVAGFRTGEDTLYRVSIEALYKNVSNAERHLVKDLFKRNQQVLTSYSVCGSGRFIFLNEIYKVSAIKGLGSSMVRQKVGSSLENKVGKDQIVAIAPQFSAGNAEPPLLPPSGGSLIRKDLGR